MEERWCSAVVLLTDTPLSGAITSSVMKCASAAATERMPDMPRYTGHLRSESVHTSTVSATATRATSSSTNTSTIFAIVEEDTAFLNVRRLRLRVIGGMTRGVNVCVFFVLFCAASVPVLFVCDLSSVVSPEGSSRDSSDARVTCERAVCSRALCSLDTPSVRSVKRTELLMLSIDGRWRCRVSSLLSCLLERAEFPMSLLP